MPKKTKTAALKAPLLVAQVDHEHSKIAILHDKLIIRYKQSIEKTKTQLKKTSLSLKKTKTRLKSAKTPYQKKQIEHRIKQLMTEKAKYSEILEGLQKRNQIFRVLQKAVKTFQSHYSKAQKSLARKKKSKMVSKPKKTVKKTPQTAVKKKTSRKPKEEKSLLAHRLSTAILKINAIDKS